MSDPSSSSAAVSQEALAARAMLSLAATGDDAPKGREAEAADQMPDLLRQSSPSPSWMLASPMGSPQHNASLFAELAANGKGPMLPLQMWPGGVAPPKVAMPWIGAAAAAAVSGLQFNLHSPNVSPPGSRGGVPVGNAPSALSIGGAALAAAVPTATLMPEGLDAMPEPTGLSLESKTTTSLVIKWEIPDSLKKLSDIGTIFWFVQFCKSDDTEILGECIFPLSTSSAPVKGLQPCCEYKIMLRIESRLVQTDPPTLASPWTADVFSTLDVSNIPARPPPPLLHRISSSMAELSILAAPCQREEGHYSCAQSYMIQRLEGPIPEDGNEESWKSVPEVTSVCSHPTENELVPSLKHRRVPLTADRIYHFRVRAINNQGASPWSEVATTLPPPTPPEVKVERMTPFTATLAWAPPEGNGFKVVQYRVFQCKADDEDDVTETQVAAGESATLPSPASGAGADGADGGKFGAEVPTIAKCVSSETVGSWEGERVVFKVDSLVPNCNFKFWARAVSEAGASDASVAINVATIPLPPTQPSDVSSTDIGANSVNITWSMPRDDATNAATMFEVKWRQVVKEEIEAAGGDEAAIAENLKEQDEVEGEAWSSKQIGCPQEAGVPFACEIDGLKTDSLHAIQARGMNGGGEGPWSEVFVFSTSLPPPQQPLMFHSSDTSATSTKLSWDQPLDEAFPVTSYQLRVSLTNADDSNQELEDDGWDAISQHDENDGRLSKVVHGLQPGIEYEFQLRAINRNCHGEPTEPLKLATQCSVPSPPSQPRCLERSHLSLMVLWSPPPTNNGSEVVAYELQIRKHCDGFEWEALPEEIGNDSAEISNLEPNSSYDLRVRARNALGWSDWSPESSLDTLSLPVPQPPDSLAVIPTHNSVTLSWPHYQDHVTHYVVEMQVGDDWTQAAEFDGMISGQLARLKRDRRDAEIDGESDRQRKRAVLTLSKEGLQSNTEYKFRVSARSVGGEACSEMVCATTLWEHGTGLSEADMAKLKGLCESCECGEYCERFGRSRYDIETLSRMPPDELQKVFDRLQVLPKHRDTLRMALCQTLGPPSKPRKFAASCDSITLEWDAPETNGHPVAEYVVQYAQCGSDEDETIERNEIRCSSTWCKISNLVADADHVFRISACGQPRGLMMVVSSDTPKPSPSTLNERLKDGPEYTRMDCE